MKMWVCHRNDTIRSHVCKIDKRQSRNGHYVDVCPSAWAWNVQIPNLSCYTFWCIYFSREKKILKPPK